LQLSSVFASRKLGSNGIPCSSILRLTTKCNAGIAITRPLVKSLVVVFSLLLRHIFRHTVVSAWNDIASVLG
ncbi:MAG: hypothetical protein PV344_01160, partial [Anaplasma sp.]|nr:hypothetical protein [Anaplasma sp.]